MSARTQAKRAAAAGTKRFTRADFRVSPKTGATKRGKTAGGGRAARGVSKRTGGSDR